MEAGPLPKTYSSSFLALKLNNGCVQAIFLGLGESGLGAAMQRRLQFKILGPVARLREWVSQ